MSPTPLPPSSHPLPESTWLALLSWGVTNIDEYVQPILGKKLLGYTISGTFFAQLKYAFSGREVIEVLNSRKEDKVALEFLKCINSTRSYWGIAHYHFWTTLISSYWLNMWMGTVRIHIKSSDNFCFAYGCSVQWHELQDHMVIFPESFNNKGSKFSLLLIFSVRSDALLVTTFRLCDGINETKKRCHSRLRRMLVGVHTTLNQL